MNVEMQLISKLKLSNQDSASLTKLIKKQFQNIQKIIRKWQKQSLMLHLRELICLGQVCKVRQTSRQIIWMQL